jgi:inosine-uridine nucleoside N-ribohydrolase
MAHRVILDVDTGTDDAVALTVAALAPEIELLGATTVAGNCPVHICTENTLRVFDFLGVDVPVFEGMAKPMLRPPRHDSWEAYLDLPPAQSTAQPQHAVNWLIETLLGSACDIILVPVGPLTNIATAIRKEPRILPKVREIVMMAGGHERGNETPSAEFNVWFDPEAAKVVLNCGRPMRMVTLDATHRARVSGRDVERFRSLGTPAGEAAAICIAPRILKHDRLSPGEGPGSAPVHDALAVCSIIDPTVVTTEHVFADVETIGELTEGRTVYDTHRRSGRSPNVHVALDADEPKFVQMLTSVFSRRA